jgi:hypothetical protein
MTSVYENIRLTIHQELNRQKELIDDAEAKERTARENAQIKSRELAEAKQELKRLEDLKALNFVIQQQDKIKAVFKEFDEDHNGHVEEEEFQMALELIGVDISNPSLSYLTTACTADGKVDFVAFFDALLPESSQLPYGIEKRYHTWPRGQVYYVHPETGMINYNLELLIPMVENAMKFGTHSCLRSRRHGTLRSVERINYEE